jgi:hypothetical protein
MNATVRPLVVLLSGALCHAQPCSPTVEPMRTGFGLNAPAEHSAIFDDDGPAGAPARLFLSGGFTNAGGLTVPGLARWDGTAFSTVPNAPAGDKGAMRVFDDGSGLALYIAGPTGILQRYRTPGLWDLLAVPQFNGLDGRALSFAAFDPDNQGPRPVGLFALVYYPALAGEANSVLWRYDHQGWTRLSGLVPKGKIVAYDADGAGPAPWDIYHYFNLKRPSPHRIVGYINRFRTDHWELIARTSGTDDLGIQDATVFFNAPSTPPTLVVTGGFNSLYTPSGWMSTARVAAWNGSLWRNFNTQIGRYFQGSAAGTYYGMSTPIVMVGGPAPVTNAPYSLWESQWSSLPQPTTPWQPFDNFRHDYLRADRISLIREFDPDGAGPGQTQLVVSGDLQLVGHNAAENFATWTPNIGFDSYLPGPSGPVFAFQVFSDNSGRKLYAAGSFARVGRETVNNITRWNGQTWEPVGGGLAPGVFSHIPAMAVHNDGSGWALHAAVNYSIGNQARANIARWNGAAWAFLSPGGSVGPSWSPPLITSMASHDPDGPGPLRALLYVGGRFTSYEGLPAAGLVVWDGLSWSAVPGFQEGAISTVKSLNDGSGPALYIGGDTISIEGLPGNNAFRLRASGWESLPQFPQGQFAWTLTDIALDSTTGSLRPVAVFLTFGFEQRTVFRLDGATWTDLQTPPDLDGNVARHVVDAGGPSLYVGRHRYTGAGWERLDPFPVGPPSIPDPPVLAISPVFDDGSGLSVFIGGTFTLVEGATSRLTGTGRVARVRLCGPGPVTRDCPANCDGSDGAPLLSAADFSCFLARYAATDPRADCDHNQSLNVADFTCFFQQYAGGCP